MGHSSYLLGNSLACRPIHSLCHKQTLIMYCLRSVSRLFRFANPRSLEEQYMSNMTVTDPTTSALTTSILNLPPEIMRLIFEELYCQGYQFSSIANVCQKWRLIVHHTVFRGPTQQWVYSQNHGCLVAYRGSQETSRLRQVQGCLSQYGRVHSRLCNSSLDACGRQTRHTGRCRV